MALIGAINCLSGVGNTGNPQCFFDPAFLSGAVMVPKGASYDTTANSGNVLTTLSANFYNTNKAARWYPLYDFEKPTDSSDKLTLQSMPNGAKHPVREGFNDWMFQYFDGGLTKHLNARLFNGSNWDFFFIDTDLQTGLQRLIGIQGATSPILQAFPCNPGGFFWAHPWGLNTGTERSRYELQFQFNQRYTNTKGLTQFQSVPFTFDTSLPGLVDMNILASATVNATAKNFNICLVSPTGVDIGALFTSTFTSAANWVIKTAAGVSLTITGSPTWTPSPDGIQPGYFTIVIATTGYPTPPAPIVFNTVAPTALVVLGLYYEAVPLTIAST